MGQLEAAVMELLWSRGDVETSVREVMEGLEEQDGARRLAYTTVLTVVDNLHSKGYLTRRRVGRAYAYTPRCSREEHTAQVMGEALAASSDRGAVLLRLVDQLTAAEVAELRAALDEPPA
nr:BlaI/MecI/CopY family transcriptional regulator [Nocardioides flavescens]